MIFVYDENLNKIGIIDRYNSLITAKRYKANGDCEVYLPATRGAIDLLRLGRYVGKTDDFTVYRINRVELLTDAENGNFLTVTGIDAKAFIDQRIILQTYMCNGNAERFALRLVNDSLGVSASRERELKNSGGEYYFLTEEKGLTDTLTEQVSYRNLGEKIREYCERFGWGYKTELQGNKLVFSFYVGTDRSAEVVFSPSYENITTSDYAEDRTNMGNFCLVGGQGEGASRIKTTVGTATGKDRYELFVDAKELSKEIRYGDLIEAYPNGSIVQSGGVYYYQQNGVNIAILQQNPPAENDTCQLTDTVYTEQLAAKGRERIAEYGAAKSFQSKIFPYGTWEYGRDFFLGDIVKVENEFGISVNARIVEIVEVEDEKGFSLEPKYEYLTEE